MTIGHIRRNFDHTNGVWLSETDGTKPQVSVGSIDQGAMWIPFFEPRPWVGLFWYFFKGKRTGHQPFWGSPHVGTNPYGFPFKATLFTLILGEKFNKSITIICRSAPCCTHPYQWLPRLSWNMVSVFKGIYLQFVAFVRAGAYSASGIAQRFRGDANHVK